MKKIWGYIAVFLGGALTMALAAMKWFTGDKIEITIRKVKKNAGDTTIPIHVEKKTRKERRADK